MLQCHFIVKIGLTCWFDNTIGDSLRESIYFDQMTSIFPARSSISFSPNKPSIMFSFLFYVREGSTIYFPCLDPKQGDESCVNNYV
jgi:hypothetical protein